MDVVIVSKTHMSHASCVGAVTGNGEFVRLLNEYGYNQDHDTSLKIGDVWTIEYLEKENRRPPHIEDILVSKKKYKFSFETIDKMVDYLKGKLNIKIWEGSTDILFDSKIQWTIGGSGYISETGEIPDNSVGFWIPAKDLIRNDFQDKVKYSYPIRWRSITFVGFQKPVEIIPAGTLIRVSLARWWSPNDEERCYLQLSGWYGLPEPENNDIKEIDDIPF